MREITMQVVFKLDGPSTTDAQVREIEWRLRKAAQRNLVFIEESVSVATVMDRKVKE